MATLCQAGDPLTEPVVLVLGGSDHGSCSVNEQGSKVSVASLADAQQPLLAARAVLPWREPERGRHLPAVGELLPVAHRCHQRGCDDRPDTAKLLQALCHRIALRDQRDFPIQFTHTSIQCQEIAPESVQQPTEPFSQAVLRIVEPKR